jgi:hypothetical protein
VRGMSELIGQALSAIAQNPALGPLMKEITLFGSRAYKIGRTMEESIEDAFDQAIRNPTPQTQEQQDPLLEMRKADLAANIEKKKLDIAAKQQEMSLDKQGQLIDLQAKQAENDMDKQLAAMKFQTAKLEEQLAQQRLAIELMQSRMGIAA